MYLQTCSTDHPKYPRPQAGQKHQCSDKKKQHGDKVQCIQWQKGLHEWRCSTLCQLLSVVKYEKCKLHQMIFAPNWSGITWDIAIKNFHWGVFPWWQCKILWIKSFFGKKICILNVWETPHTGVVLFSIYCKQVYCIHIYNIITWIQESFCC